MTSPSDVPPLRVGPGHVPEQVAVRPGVGVEQQGQVAGDQAALAVRGQDGEAVPPHELVEPGRVGLGEGGGDVHGSTQAPPISAIARSGPAPRRRKQPVLRQHFLNRSPLPHGHGSLRPSFSRSSLSPWTTRRPRLTWVSLRIPPAALGHHLESRTFRRRNPGRIGHLLRYRPDPTDASSTFRRLVNKPPSQGDTTTTGEVRSPSMGVPPTPSLATCGFAIPFQVRQWTVRVGGGVGGCQRHLIWRRPSRPSPSPPPTPSRIASGPAACTGIRAGPGFGGAGRRPGCRTRRLRSPDPIR